MPVVKLSKNYVVVYIVCTYVVFLLLVSATEQSEDAIVWSFPFHDRRISGDTEVKTKYLCIRTKLSKHVYDETLLKHSFCTLVSKLNTVSILRSRTFCSFEIFGDSL